MPLEPPDQQHLRAADGFIELGLFEEASSELENIDPNNRAAPEVLALRVAIYHGLQKWDLLQVVAQKLADYDVQNVDWVVSYAYATRRVESIEAAKEILLNAAQRFPNEPVIPYNLACHEGQLKNIQVANQIGNKETEVDIASSRVD